MSDPQLDQYSALVKQVYIDPIRTVVIVDDDFPTIDALLYSAENASPSTTQSDVGAAVATSGLQSSINMRFDGKLTEVKRVQDMIQHCRKHNPPWLVDVHNGNPDTGVDEIQIAPRLHQSDLMILDYHLDGDLGDGKRALDILKALAANDQFNLVVVYTKGISGNIYEVYEQIAMTLAYRNWSEPLSTSDHDMIVRLINDWEDELENIEVEKQLLAYLPTKIYFQYRTRLFKFKDFSLAQQITTFFQSCPEEVRRKYNNCFDAANGNAGKGNFRPELLFKYAISLRHKKIYNSLSPENYGCIACNFETEFNWLRLDKIFITIVDKTTVAPTSLEARLLTALEKWAPGPHQLLMAKMRAQLGKKGVNAESAVLANRPLQAGWLHEFLNNDTDVESVTTQSINRHWEALGDVIYQDVKRFAKKVFEHFRNENKEVVRARYMPLGYTDEQQVAHLNYYYSAKPIDSQHLMTGQVFELVEHDTPDEKIYWVCLSPACDLVPAQKTSGWRGRLGSAMPFLAVKLQEAKISEALRDINHNRFLFIQAGGEINAFKFTESQGSSLPAWEQMFANNSGAFFDAPENERRRLTIQRMLDDNGSLGLKSYDAKIVCQLRYEYALNLLQRLGHALTRVGLDFKSSTPSPKQ